MCSDPPPLFLSPAQPQNHAEKQEVTFNLDPVPVARCVSAGGRPPARVSWLSPLDGEAKETQGSGPLPGTVTVTSRYTVTPLSEADGVKVICKVEHESFQEPKLLPVTLSVRCEYIRLRPPPPTRPVTLAPLGHRLRNPGVWSTLALWISFCTAFLPIVYTSFTRLSTYCHNQ